jgi:hypothetical protein
MIRVDRCGENALMTRITFFCCSGELRLMTFVAGSCYMFTRQDELRTRLVIE